MFELVSDLEGEKLIEQHPREVKMAAPIRRNSQQPFTGNGVNVVDPIRIGNGLLRNTQQQQHQLQHQQHRPQGAKSLTGSEDNMLPNVMTSPAFLNSHHHPHQEDGEAEEEDTFSASSATDIPTPPDGGWGWAVVFASFMIHVIGK